MKRCLLLLVLCVSLPALARTIRVPYHKTKTLLIPHATAVFAINSDYVGASIKAGVISLFGKAPGTTSVIVVTASGNESLQVTVPVPPPVYPPGFERTPATRALYEHGSYDLRYVSNPGQLQNDVDFSQRQGNRATHVFIGNANLFSTGPGSRVSTVSFPLAYYQISTPGKSVTFLDQYTTVSPLTVEDTLLRGIHVRDGGWFFHYGDTSLATFQNLFLPTGRQTVAGGGIQIPLSGGAKLIPSLFYFGKVSHGSGQAQPGAVGSLRFEDHPSDELSYSAELGISRGIGASGHFRYATRKTHLTADLRYEPRGFATVVTRNLHGFYSTLHGSDKLTNRLRADLFFTGNRYEIPQFTEVDLASNLNLNYVITPRWSVLGGAGYSYFRALHSAVPVIRSLNLPMGVSYGTSHFGDDFFYQYAINGGQDRGGNEFRNTVHASWGHFFWSGFADRQTEAPSLSFIFEQVPGLSLALQQLGLTATTPEQIAQLLQNNAGLVSLGFVQGASVNLNPERTQAGSNLSWLELGGHRQQLNLSFLYTSLQMLMSSSQSAIQSVFYSRKLTATNRLWVSYSLFRTHIPGAASSFQSQVEVGVRHQFDFVPRFLIPSKHGTISGVVFKDSEDAGVFHANMEGLPGVEVDLDGVRHTHTDSLGFYSFRHVPYGLHTVEVHFQSSRPFFYTTPSRATVEVNTVVNFGVGYSLSRIFGSVVNDAGSGIEGIRIEVRGRGRVLSITTTMRGEFQFTGLTPGNYAVRADPESFPPGYAIVSLKPQTVVVAPNSPARATFTVRAYRAISGHVTVYDRGRMREVPVPGLQVSLQGTRHTNETDRLGVYIFRNLPTGTYKVTAMFEGHRFTRTIKLPASPSFLRHANLKLGAVDKFNPGMVSTAPGRKGPR